MTDPTTALAKALRDWLEQGTLHWTDADAILAALAADGWVLVNTRDVLVPHHLGFPVSGKTGTYDPNTVMVDRTWYNNLMKQLRTDLERKET